MRPPPQVKYSVDFVTTAPTGPRFCEPVFTTVSKEAWDTLRRLVVVNALPLPKTQFHPSNSSRPMKVLSIPDEARMYYYVGNGKMPSHRYVGEIFNTVAEAAEALGLKDSSLRQMLYQARAKNPSGLDTEIVIRGVEIGYCDKSRSMNKDQSSQIVLPPQPEV